MPDYIKNNSKRLNKCKQCACYKQQSYNKFNYGENVIVCTPNTCRILEKCNRDYLNFQKYILKQQNLYALMRRKPELFPIISSVKGLNLTKHQQRLYSNNWYRQFGTSQSLPVNDVWGGFYVVGSEVPYVN